MSFGDFFDKRSELLAKNDSFKRSANLSFSEDEQKAQEKLASLIKKFNDENPKFSMHKTSLMEFHDDVAASDLYRAICKMPKGALHHLHNMTSVLMTDLVRDCLTMPNIWYNPDGEDICRKATKPEGYISFAEAREKFDSEERFVLHMADLLQIDTATAAKGNSIAIWNKFDAIFGRIFGFFNHIEIYKKILRLQFQSCLKDNIYRVELRHAFDMIFDDKDELVSTEDEMQIFYDFEKEFKEQCPEFSIGVIAIGFKAAPREDTIKRYEQAFELRKKHPGMVMGFDLVQEENTNPQTSEFMDAWEKSEEFEKKHGVDCPFYFHAGETESIEMKNVADSIVMGSKRIGHGLSALKFPLLIDEIKSAGICIESCPLSNQVLGYVHDMRAHPCGVMLKMGVPITISNDDPGLFGYTGITMDMIWAILGWEIDLRDLKQICKDSIEYSGLDTDGKKSLMEYWEQKWTEYVAHLNSL